MTDKLRDFEQYLRLQVKESDRLAFASSARHDSTDVDKWRAVADAYATCYTRLFGELKREEL